MNYSLTSNAPVQCEFVKVQDKAAYTEGQDYGLGRPLYEDEGDVLSGSVIKWLKDGGRVVFFGDKGSPSGNGYGYVKLHILQDCEIIIVPSTEGTYDLGYICESKPCLTKAEVEADADVYTSGTTTLSHQCSAGDTLYIGYTKDTSVYGEDDKVTFYFDEI